MSMSLRSVCVPLAGTEKNDLYDFVGIGKSDEIFIYSVGNVVSHTDTSVQSAQVLFFLYSVAYYTVKIKHFFNS